MRSYIALIPGFLAALYFYSHFLRGSKAPVARTFLVIYLPTLILLPHEFSVDIPVLPNLNFTQSAIIPIFLAYLFLSEKKLMPVKKGIRVLDVLVVSYALICVISEYYNTGMGDDGGQEQNLWRTVLHRNTLNIIIPYILARKLIHAHGLTQDFAKILAICCLVSLAISAYEWRMVVNPYIEILKRFFPHKSDFQWIPDYRYGLVRISGPFGHPIHFGIGVATAFIMNHWLTKNGFWKKNFSFLFLNSYLKGALIGLLLFIGLILTFSRGPLYSTIVALFILGLGYSRNRFIYLIGLGIVFAVTGVIVLQYLTYYSEIGREVADSQLERTAIYRANLINAYVEFMEEKFWFGWGAITWPRASSMGSIDNQYLFILITHGFIALSLLCTILVVSALKLFYAGMRIPSKFRMNRSLAFTLLSVIFMLSVAFITVFMTHQVEALSFIIVGLAQGFLDAYPAKKPYIASESKKGKHTPSLAPA